jgi:small-conductance mechanosensitive channel
VQWKIGAHPVSLRTLLEGGLSAGFVLVLALWVSAALEARLLDGASGEQLSLRKAGANLLRAGLLFVGLLVALSAVGIDLTALSVLGGALGVGIGFGLQKLAANYVSGFVILAERSVRIGDMVRVGEFEGRITDITTRYTVIRAATGREAIVPNETLITGVVENLTLADRKLLVQSQVSVAYGTDVASLRARINEVVQGVERVLADPGPATHLLSFGADGLDLGIYFWIADPENGQANVRSAVNLAVLDLLQREGIEIPYPQRTLHFPRPDAPARAEGRPGG